MAGELARRDWAVLDKDAAVQAVLLKLAQAEFADALTDTAQDWLDKEFEKIQEYYEIDEGSFVIQLFLSGGVDEPISSWAALEYDFFTDEEDYLCVAESESYFLGNGDIGDDTSCPLVYPLEWDDVNWFAGYGFLLGKPGNTYLPVAN